MTKQCLVAALVLVAAAADAGSFNILMAQLVHRHGARTPIVTSNASVLCPGRGGCGILNDEGKAMLRQLGTSLRDRYRNLSHGQWFDTPNYDPDVVYSRSTDVQRTLQSSDGLLWGLYPNASTYFPAIDTVSLGRDVLLVVNSLPSFQIPFQLGLPTTYLPKVESYALARLSRAVLQRIGDELSLSDLCANNVAACALEAQDVAASFNADGTLPQFPTAQANYATLNDFRRYFNSMLFQYNASTPTDAARGSLGYGLASQMLDNFDRYPTGPWSLMEYSAHDTTVMPFCSALGVNDAMLPLFGQAYVLELLRSEDDGRWYIRVLQGVPVQTPGPHEYTWGPLSIKCVGPGGGTYTAADGVCPYGDFSAFVRSTAPRNAAGICYLADAVRSSILCDVPSAPLTAACLSYRKQCPAYACPDGYFLLYSDWSCAPINSLSVISAAHLVVVSVACTMGGTALGAVLVWYLKTFRSRTQPKYPVQEV